MSKKFGDLEYLEFLPSTDIISSFNIKRLKKGIVIYITKDNTGFLITISSKFLENAGGVVFVAIYFFNSF